MRTATLLALLPLAMAAPSKKRDSPAPVLRPRGATVVEGKYIVKMKSDAAAGSVNVAMKGVASDADYIYNSGKFSGFASSLSDDEVKTLQDDPNV